MNVGFCWFAKKMCRKTQMSMWKEGHRRSPRISALDAWKAHKEKDGSVNVPQNSIQVMPMEHNGLGPPSRTRARKKRKLRPVQDVAVSSVTTTATQVHNLPFSSSLYFFFLLGFLVNKKLTVIINFWVWFVLFRSEVIIFYCSYLLP